MISLKMIISLLSGVTLLNTGLAQAHFQMIIPSDDMVMQSEPRKLNLDLMFWHPFEGQGMNMAKPVQFGVLRNNKNIDLLETLKASKFKDINGDNFDGYTTSYNLRKPGDHIFFTEPQPYWEAAEETFIIHYTKVIINAFGMEEGWDAEVGLKTEIMPLTRPYGLYTGNIFQGIVKIDGKPIPFSTVEVEYYSEDGHHHVEAGPMITQVIKADANGVFTYAMPKAGWWTFAALNEDERTMQHEGKDYPIEIGAVLWVKTHDMQ
ncbi:Additional periplasmic component NikK of nickel ECF transporter [hydrothermal vent metagenome]|uniref:Additional periplasmic component NikK of nickel ECF transporter n=1 Tax=hydrothermal vent metagenome TaxID=652676 RepID=A0A3B0ZCR1_9ZZZZ